LSQLRMRRLVDRPRHATPRLVKREITETYVRYKVVVTRVQVAERFVRATSEEDAAVNRAGFRGGRVSWLG